MSDRRTTRTLLVTFQEADQRVEHPSRLGLLLNVIGHDCYWSLTLDTMDLYANCTIVSGTRIEVRRVGERSANRASVKCALRSSLLANGTRTSRTAVFVRCVHLVVRSAIRAAVSTTRTRRRSDQALGACRGGEPLRWRPQPAANEATTYYILADSSAANRMVKSGGSQSGSSAENLARQREGAKTRKRRRTENRRLLLISQLRAIVISRPHNRCSRLHWPSNLLQVSTVSSTPRTTVIRWR